jgi:hypothetical protein
MSRFSFRLMICPERLRTNSGLAFHRATTSRRRVVARRPLARPERFRAVDGVGSLNVVSLEIRAHNCREAAARSPARSLRFLLQKTCEAERLQQLPQKQCSVPTRPQRSCCRSGTEARRALEAHRSARLLGHGSSGTSAATYRRRRARARPIRKATRSAPSGASRVILLKRSSGFPGLRPSSIASLIRAAATLTPSVTTALTSAIVSLPEGVCSSVINSSTKSRCANSSSRRPNRSGSERAAGLSTPLADADHRGRRTGVQLPWKRARDNDKLGGRGRLRSGWRLPYRPFLRLHHAQRIPPGRGELPPACIAEHEPLAKYVEIRCARGKSLQAHAPGGPGAGKDREVGLHRSDRRSALGIARQNFHNRDLQRHAHAPRRRTSVDPVRIVTIIASLKRCPQIYARERRFQMDWDNIRIFLSVARAGQFSASEADETRGYIFSCFGFTQSSHA